MRFFGAVGGLAAVGILVSVIVLLVSDSREIPIPGQLVLLGSSLILVVFWVPLLVEVWRKR